MKQKIEIKNKQVQKSNLVKKFSTGAISACVWNNETINQNGEVVEFRTVSFDRRYLDKNTNEWKSTNTLRIGDLPKATLVLQKAYDFLMLKEDTEVVVDGDF